MATKELGENQRHELQLEAESAEKHVKRKNIFYRTNLERLVEYEDKISQIALETGLEAGQVIAEAEIKSPIEILNRAIDDWRGKLHQSRLGTEQELIGHLKKEFQVSVRQITREIMPTDPQEEGDSETSDDIVPEDRNRIQIALQVLLSLIVHEENIQLEDIDIVIGVPPKDSWRKRPYWIIDIQKYRIAIFINNQGGNQTFVAGYEFKKDLDVMTGWTKKQFKQEKANGAQIVHFKYYDDQQYEEDLKKNLSDVIEKTVPVPMNEKYFRNAANIRTDLQGFIDDMPAKKKRGKPMLEELEPDNIRLVPHKCVNGEIITGGTWLNRAGIALHMADTRRKAQKKHPEIIDEIFRIAGMTKPVKPGAMDEKYFQTPGNIRKDLDAYLEAIKKHKGKNNKKPPETLADLSTDSMSKVETVCANGEKVNGINYILRAGNPLGLSKGTGTAKKNMKEILDKLKEHAGVEVKNYPPMDAGYFTETNVRKDLSSLAAKSGIELELLTTTNLDGTSFLCSNGETVEGKTYVSRATKAFNPEITLSKKANSLMGQTFKRLKKMIGIEVTEYPSMDSAYFNRENIAIDLENLRKSLVSSGKKLNRIPQTIAELSTYDCKQADFVCRTGEKVSGMQYLYRAAKALNRLKKDRSFSSGDVLAKLLNMVNSGSTPSPAP